jgi:hypothetical protein
MEHNHVNISAAAFWRIRNSHADFETGEAPRREPPQERKQPPVRPPPQKRPPVEEPGKKSPVGDPPPKKRDKLERNLFARSTSALMPSDGQLS